MTSEFSHQCVQNSDNVENAGQMLHDVGEKDSIQENCETLETSYENQCISGTPIVPNNMVPLSVKSCIHVDGGSKVGPDYALKCDDFAVIKQTLADICDEISTQDCLNINSDVIDETREDLGCVLMAEDVMSSACYSAKLELTVSGIASENSIIANTNKDMGNDHEKNCEVITKVQSGMYCKEQSSNPIAVENCRKCNTDTLLKDYMKFKITSNCCGNSEKFSITIAQQCCNDIPKVQQSLRHDVQFDCCNSHLRNEGDQNVDMTLENDTEQSGAHRHSFRDYELVKSSIGTTKQEDYVETDSIISNKFVKEAPQEMDENLIDTCNLNENITKTNSGVTRNECVSTNELYNKLGAHYEQSAEQSEAHVIAHGSVVANQVGAPPDDVLYVMSVVEEDKRYIGISTVNGTPEGCQALTNDQKKQSESNVEMTSTDGTHSSEISSTSLSGEFSCDDSDSESEEDVVTARIQMAEQEKIFVTGPPTTRDELCLSDLPPLEPLDTFVDESVELAPLGEIANILYEDTLVIIKSFENVPPLDSDSVLFLEDRSGFGKVFEIFGQVQSPHYCVRFNNEEEIKSTNVEIGQVVYFAPDTKDLTNFVFVSKLKSVKGSDASWQYDQEPPIEVVEFSDDEAESRAKAAKKKANKLSKRNEAHKQEQGLIEAATSSKKQKSSGPNFRHQRTSSSFRPKPEDQFPRQPCSHVQPPTLKLAPKPPRGIPPRFGDQRIPLHPPIRGPLPRQIQPQFHCPPQFIESLNRPHPRSHIMPSEHPQPYCGTGVTLFRPPPQTYEAWRQPFQMFSPPPPQPPPQPQQGISLQNNHQPLPQNWASPRGVAPQYREARPWMSRENGLPNRPPSNQHRLPVGQPYTQAPVQFAAFPQYVKEEYPQNTFIQSCQNRGAPEQNLGGISGNIGGGQPCMRRDYQPE